MATQSAAAADPSALTVARDSALSLPLGLNNSSVNEPSVGTRGDAIFQTGNWYAAKSLDNGTTWTYVNPYSTFPTTGAFAAGFCCDQRVTQDSSRGLIMWYLQYLRTGTGPTDQNGVRLAVTTATGLAPWTYYDITPANCNFPLGKWFDFPHLQTSTNYLYLTSNVFDTSAGGTTAPTHAVIARMSLAELAAGVSLSSFTCFSQSRFFGISTVSGATSTMYFGAVDTTTSIAVLTWPEADSTPSVPLAANVTGLATTNVGASFTCPVPVSALDPCGRSDARMETGWITGSELGFMWNSGLGTSRPYPFVRTAILNASTLAVTSQPDMFSTTSAFLYPTVAVDARGHIAGEVSALGGTKYTETYVFIRDDLSPDPATMGWQVFQVDVGDAGTDKRWGDYSGIVQHDKYPNTFVAVGHVQVGGPANANVVAHNIWFGRSRDVGGLLACTTTSFTAVPASPQAAGTPVTFTATASGCTTPQFKYWILPPGGSWTVARDWGPAVFAWTTTGLAAGTYRVTVYARATGSTADYEAYGAGSYDLTP